MKAGLPSDPPQPGKERLDREAPAAAKLAGESLGRLMASTQASISVRWDIRDDVSRRERHPCHDELGGDGSERAGSALLPAANERAGGVCVDDRGAGRREREPPARALAAALDRPGCMSTAPPAKRGVDRHEPGPAGVAEERPGLSAGDAA